MFKRVRQGNEPSDHGLPRARPRALKSVVDISGPLPEASESAPLPFLEVPPKAPAPLAPWRRVDTSALPREMDPFECDWPWNGWTGPRYQDIIRSPERSPTFEEDLQRVLAIFAN